LRSSVPSGATADSDSNNNFSITPPIELVYADHVRLADIYTQVRGDVKLTEQKISRKGTGEIEGGGKFGIGEAKAKIGREAEESSTFTPVDASDPQKVVKVVEFLHGNKRLLPIRSIELQSQELSELDHAVNVLQVSNGISLSKTPIEERRRALIEENLNRLAPNEFINGSWVVVDGEAKISRNDRILTLRFDYVPSLPDRATFLCNIPLANLKAESPLANKEAKSLELKIFGKIGSIDGTPTHARYTLSCYAVYR
jgi:hypothetical protein